MSTDYSRSLLRIALAQICQSLGWQAVQSTPLELLTDVLERYILNMGKYAHRYSEQFGRTEPNLDDLGLVFQEMGVNLHELTDYVKHAEPVPFALDVPRYPVPKPNRLHFPKPNSRELLEREEHVHDHLPAMHPGWDEEIVSSSGIEDHEAPMVLGEDGNPGDKRFPGGADELSPSKRLKILPDEAAPSEYQMKGVTMSHTGSIVGEGKLPDPKAPPPPTPSATVTSAPSLFKTPSSVSLSSENRPKEDVPVTVVKPEPANGPKSPVNIDVESIEEIKPEIMSVKTLVNEHKSSPKSPRGGRKKSPKGERLKHPASKLEKPIASAMSPKLPKKSPGRPRSKSPAHSPAITIPKSPPPESPMASPKTPSMGSPAGTPKSPRHLSPPSQPPTPKSPPPPPQYESPPPSAAPTVTTKPKTPKSPGRPPGRPPKSPARQGPKSPGRPSKSPGRPPKSPGRPPKSPGRPPKSPGVIGRSPGRPPKSPGTLGRSPGRPPKRSPGRPPKSPGRSPGRGRPRKDSTSNIPASPIGQYLLTGEPPIGEKVLTKAQLKSPPPRRGSTKGFAPSSSIQKFDFTDSPPEELEQQQQQQQLPASAAAAPPPTAGVICETVSETTTIEKPVPKKSKSTKSKGSGKRKHSLTPAGQDPERRTEKSEKALKVEPDTASSSGRVTPDWIKQAEAKIQKHDQENESTRDSFDFPMDEPPKLSPVVPFGVEHVPSPAREEKVKSKKDKNKDKVKTATMSHTGSEVKKESKQDKKTKQEKKLMKKKLREKLLGNSPCSSPDISKKPEKEKPPEKFEFPSLSETPKPHKEQPVIQPIRIEFGTGNEKKKLTIKMPEDSDKSDKEHKKKKKKKDKEKDKERSKDKDKKKRDKKEKHKQEKEDKKEVPKLTFKFGGGNVSVKETPRDSPKREIESQGSSSKFRKSASPAVSRNSSVSPVRKPSPVAPRIPPPNPLRLSPVRFTPSPESTSEPKTPSFGMASPAHSLPAIPSPDLTDVPDHTFSHMEHSPSPVKTPSRSPVRTRSPTPSASHQREVSPSPSPPPLVRTSRGEDEFDDESIPPPPPSSAEKKAKKGAAVFAETQGTIINENGDIIWICPACKMPDDGSPMIGCDVCDDWYHWPCVNISEEPPDDESWYCPKHREDKSPPRKTPAKRGRGRGGGRGGGRGRKKKV